MTFIHNLEHLHPDDIANGYCETPGGRQCLVCGEVFGDGEAYPIGGRFFTGERAAREHLAAVHPGYFTGLLESPIKYNPFTANQKLLLALLREGLSDNEISTRLGVSTSTVRHQRFTFREKAKQAKMYLALYALAMDRNQSDKEEIVPMHDSARMTDERYVVTQAEKEQILQSFFTSTNPLRLAKIPAREKKKIVVLARITEAFEQQKQYSEKELNAVLSDIHSDHATLRRYLIEYGFFDRTTDCSAYWRKC